MYRRKRENTRKCPRTVTTNTTNVRQDYFNTVLNEMEKAGDKGFEELEEFCEVLQPEIDEQFPIEPSDDGTVYV